jgi:hypothetical protein
MSGVMGLGPLEENDTTYGAMTSFHVSPTRMSGVMGLSHPKKKNSSIRFSIKGLKYFISRKCLSKQFMLSVID